MIPAFDADGNLPPGIHEASWEEVCKVFGTNRHRLQLLAGLYRAAAALKLAGCKRLYIDGSFVTTKDLPGDFDCCWDPIGVVPSKLDPVLLQLRPPRIGQKIKFGGELFPSSLHAELRPPHRAFIDFFQTDKNTGKPKGIIRLELGGLP